jgi:hypothetical protein
MSQFAYNLFRPIFASAAFLRLEQKPLTFDRAPKFPLRAEIFNIFRLELVNLADGKHGNLFGRHPHFSR